MRPNDYVSLQAYLPYGQDDALERLRRALRDGLGGVAVTAGYGPRFLHSTGQLHKGGPDEVVAVQIVPRTPTADLPIPGYPYDFGTLIAAQALGDHQSLLDHGRRVLRSPSTTWRRSEDGTRGCVKIGMVGLGRMGGNMTKRLIEGGHEVVAYDRSADALKAARPMAPRAAAWPSLVAALAPPRAVWVMVPSGEPPSDHRRGAGQPARPGRHHHRRRQLALRRRPAHAAPSPKRASPSSTPACPAACGA